jgi:sulfur carrier protein ThiS
MRVIYRDKVYEFTGRTTVRDLIKKVGLNPQAVLALRDGQLVTDDVIVCGEETVRLIAVVSGG